MAQRLKGTFTCYRCGQKFDNEFKHRHRVQTGSSWGWSLRGYRAYYHTVNLCPNCYKTEIKAEKLGRLIVGAIILMVILAIVILSLLGQSLGPVTDG